jgi:putative lipoprotein
MRKRLITRLLLPLVALVAASCGHYEDRIPPSPVRVSFPTVGEWNVYGISGAYDYKYFIKRQLIPAGYPYTALSETGFGGVLLVGDMHGDPHAYDMACPVELRYDIRVAIDPDIMQARCEVCGSTYDVFDNHGMPTSGPAKDREYRLARYNVTAGGAGEYMIITR